MAADSPPPDSLEDLSPVALRRRLIRLLGKRDMEKHEQIYEDLAKE